MQVSSSSSPLLKTTTGISLVCSVFMVDLGIQLNYVLDAKSYVVRHLRKRRCNLVTIVYLKIIKLKLISLCHLSTSLVEPQKGGQPTSKESPGAAGSKRPRMAVDLEFNFKRPLPNSVELIIFMVGC
ncbi:jg6750 [Pararge aegeria aegeria]|uniref:Jg6750 protein n=1 Tax=Pararge aegeria aegeria TaxID=348720 RepID=A0A8S4R3A8_9NEOP|nr:jg6750 [Pararge aegeria aegeria]